MTLTPCFNSLLWDGALQPPFQRPIGGHEALIRFFAERLSELELVATGKRGITENRIRGWLHPIQGHPARFQTPCVW